MGITSNDIAAQRAMLARGEEKRLRDQFATAALPFVAKRGLTDEQVAEHCYRWAETMLNERAKRQAIAATEKAMRDAEDFVAIREQFQKWCKDNSSSPDSYDQSDEKRTDANMNRVTLTDEEREAIGWAVSAARNVDHPDEDTLRNLLERLK